MLLFRLTIANLKMILRNRQALFWALAFPVVMLGIFGIVGGFRNTTVTVGVVDYANDALSKRLIRSLSDLPVSRWRSVKTRKRRGMKCATETWDTCC